MKKTFTLLFTLATCLGAFAQSFSDDFESYTAGTNVAQNSNTWVTWAGAGGGADDVKVTDAKSASGSNSIHLVSTAENGGPQDLVLPFGGEYNTGTFVISWNMFIESGKGAYFNFQESSTIGQVWSLDADFVNDGSFNVYNGTSGSLTRGNYPSNTWFNISIEANLNSNSYTLKIDDIEIGQFQNYSRQIASLNLYPRNGDSYFIDDISYEYTSASSTTSNASITYIDNVVGKLAGALTTPSIEIRNLGTEVITAAEVELDYNGSKTSKTLTDLNISPNGLYSFDWDNEVEIVSGQNEFKVTVNTINNSTDDDASDNTKTLILDPITPPTGRVVIGEEATGTWCGWCPRGAVALENMEKDYHGFFQGIAVHNGDPMKDGNYDLGLGTLISGYPSAVVDRGADIDPGQFESDFLQRILTTPTGVMATAAEYNEQTGELKVSLTTTLNEDITGNYKIACVIIEDGISKDESGYAQSNSYAGGGSGIMGGYESLPHPVPAAQMTYDHVARAISPKFTGKDNAFGASATSGTSFTHNFSFMMDYSWNMDKMHIVGMFIEPNGRINNGSTITMQDALAKEFVNGVEIVDVVDLSIPSLFVYPNPAQNKLNVNLSPDNNGSYSIYNNLGQQVWSGELAGNTQIDISSFNAGAYILKGEKISQKFIKK